MRSDAHFRTTTSTSVSIRMLALAAFGLLGAVGAHALVFGNGHRLGGNLHGQLVDMLFGAAALTALLVFAKSLSGGRLCADGSALAAALSSSLPSLRATILTSCGWFAAIESCERAHAMPILAIIPAVLAVCAVLLGGAHLAVRALRAARLLFASLDPSALSVAPHVCRRIPSRLHARSIAQRRHLFSRPPPVTA